MPSNFNCFYCKMFSIWYFFCVGLGVLRAYDSLKFCCGQVSLKNPDRITSVNLRKYTATIAQVYIFIWWKHALGKVCHHHKYMFFGFLCVCVFFLKTKMSMFLEIKSSFKYICICKYVFLYLWNWKAKRSALCEHFIGEEVISIISKWSSH